MSGATALFGGGQSKKKASRRRRVVGSEGDDKEEEEKAASCIICSSNSPIPHKSYCCPWNVRIPLDYVPKVDPDWMVVCKNCQKERPYANEKACACACGYNGNYVCRKTCVACFSLGHKNNEDTACKYYGKTGDDDPFQKIVNSILEKLAKDPQHMFGYVQC